MSAADKVTSTRTQGSLNGSDNVTSGGSLLPGFRLRRLEMLNWGTFHHTVGVLAPNARWTLLVGENGSGKSTAVDALRTLLVPPRSLNYNDASGEQKKKDRTRRSYVRGAWATSSQEDSAAAKVEYLRKPGEQSILLAVFVNERTGAAATLLQVLWETNEKIDEVFAVARGDRNIREHLAELGKSHELKKTLRARGFEPAPSFTAYEEIFRGRLGIPGRGALEVFNQAIGVKEVPEINQFIRRHMLEPSEVAEFLTDHVKPHYRELDACWQAIQKAKTQIAKLEPIADCHRRIEDAKSRRQDLERLQQAAVPYFTHRHIALRRNEAAELERQLQSLNEQKLELQAAQEADQAERDSKLRELAAEQVEQAIQRIQAQMQTVQSAKDDKQRRYEELRTNLALLERKGVPLGSEAFEQLRTALSSERGLVHGNIKSTDEKRDGFKIEQAEALRTRATAAAELENLRQRQALIPREFVAIRDALCEATGIEVQDLPFAGELLEVKAEFSAWTGAIERLLHAFGVSLLVPEQHYYAATSFINSQRLMHGTRGVRLAYNKVGVEIHASSASVLSDTQRVPGRMNFHTDHVLVDWVKTELARRFDHVCCRDIKHLKEVDYGLTVEGLIRNGPSAHVKDDRKAVNDASQYVLGWSTEAKIRAWTEEYEQAERAATQAGARAAAAGTALGKLNTQLAAIEAVLAIERFALVDFSEEQQTLLRLTTEIAELEASSDKRKALQDQLKTVEGRIRVRAATLEGLTKRAGGLERDQRANQAELLALLASPAAVEFDLSAWEERFAELQEEKRLTLLNIVTVSEQARERVRRRMDQQTGQINNAVREMLPKMAAFLIDYAEETADKKAEAEYSAEFVALQARLRTEDLPRHEEEFEKFLSLNLIGDMAMFSTKLKQHQKDIEARIQTVNTALKSIAFSKGTHVQIVARNKSASDETAAFRAELKACLAGGLNPTAEDRIRIFDRIRELIAKFEKDDPWMRRVTDVRNWLEFGVQEYADADGSKLNYYAASTGKSGGQKTKLAFTILASAITAQYGLAGASADSPTFRLVIIDEAFARTDEANSDRALKLFQSLGLQLMVVSPFDAKSRIVEDYVDSFHLAVNPDDNNSHIRQASRAEYDAVQEKVARQDTADSSEELPLAHAGS